MAPFLAELLTDSYDVVRYIGYHSLKKIPGYADFDYDFVGEESSRRESRASVIDAWNRSSDRPVFSIPLMIDSDGKLMKDAYQRLRNNRLDPPIVLIE